MEARFVFMRSNGLTNPQTVGEPGLETVVVEASALEKRNAKGQFVPGSAGGPGLPKGYKFCYSTEFARALLRVEKAKGKKFLVHAVEQGFADNKVLPHILDRVEPVVKDLPHGPASVTLMYGYNLSAPTLIVTPLTTTVLPHEPAS